jgi:hypothetical protein
MLTKALIFYMLIIFVFVNSIIGKDYRKQNIKRIDSIKNYYNFKKIFSKESMQLKENINGKVFMVKDTSKYSPNFLKN